MTTYPRSSSYPELLNPDPYRLRMRLAVLLQRRPNETVELFVPSGNDRAVRQYGNDDLRWLTAEGLTQELREYDKLLVRLMVTHTCLPWPDGRVGKLIRATHITND